MNRIDPLAAGTEAKRTESLLRDARAVLRKVTSWPPRRWPRRTPPSPRLPSCAGSRSGWWSSSPGAGGPSSSGCARRCGGSAEPAQPRGIGPLASPPPSHGRPSPLIASPQNPSAAALAASPQPQPHSSCHHPAESATRYPYRTVRKCPHTLALKVPCSFRPGPSWLPDARRCERLRAAERAGSDRRQPGTPGRLRTLTPAMAAVGAMVERGVYVPMVLCAFQARTVPTLSPKRRATCSGVIPSPSSLTASSRWFSVIREPLGARPCLKSEV